MNTPALEDLRRFATGQLNPGEVAGILHWLEQNPDGLNTADQLAERDTLIHTIQSVATFKVEAQWNVDAVIQKVYERSLNSDQLDQTQQLTVPQQLDHFRILHVLGQGGMGMVCEALDQRLGRKVAIKIIRSELTHVEEYRKRFLQETRAVAAIEHESIVPILSAGEASGINYIVMPLLRGETLAARLQRGPLSLPSIIKQATDIAAGLQAAHLAGIIHRDIKPSNIWLERTADGSILRARILDFGLARSIASTDQLTKINQVMGTPEYMAPELARGQVGNPLTDMFSLGCVLYEAAAGRKPFTGKNALEVLLSVAESEPKRLAELRPELPAEYSELVMKMLAKTPDLRPQEMQAVIRAVGRVSDSLDQEASARSPQARADSPNRWGAAIRGNALYFGLPVALVAFMLWGIVIVIQHSDGTITRIESDRSASLKMHANGDIDLQLSNDARGTNLRQAEPNARSEGADEVTQQPLGPSTSWSERDSFVKLLEIGAVVCIRWPDGQVRNAASTADFLAGSTIIEIRAADNSKLTDDFFEAYIAPLKQLRFLLLSGTSGLTGAGRFFEKVSQFNQLVYLGASLPLDDRGCELISCCTELSTLYGFAPRFSVKGSQHLLKLQKLKEVMFFDGNVADTALGPLLELPLLQSVWIKNTVISGPFLKGDRLVPNLAEIDLSYCRYSEDPVPFLLRFPNLRTFTFEAYPEAGSSLKILSQAPNLRKVVFHSSRISDVEGFRQLARAPYIETLNLHASRYLGDEHMLALASVHPENLIVLDISNTRVTNACIDALLTLPKLKVLGLWNVDVTDEGFMKLAESKTLREIHLGSKMLTKATFSALAQREMSWEVIWIFGGRLADDSVDELARFKSLRLLGIRDTQITPEGFQRLRSLLPDTQIVF